MQASHLPTVAGHFLKFLQAIGLLSVVLLCAAGCQKTEQTDDPQLKPIEEMLDKQLPPGTPEEKVMAFLNSWRYPVLPRQKPGTIVAMIRVAGIPQDQQVTVQVTFYFDANGKLNTFRLQRSTEARLQ